MISENIITYADKETLTEHSEIPEINKVTASNMNEIKNVVNNHASLLDSLNNLVSEKLSIHLLWTNPNPDSMQKNTEIALSDDDYNFLLIFSDHTSPAFESGTLTPKGKSAMLFAIGLSTGQTARRNLTYIDDTHYQSSVPYFASSENSAACVPYQIYGIKFE